MQILLLVNSCAHFYRTSLPVILESLAAAGVPEAHTRAVIGGAASDRDDIFDGVRVHHRRWQNVDNNGLLWAATELEASVALQYEWIFYLHDTCVVGPEFYTRIKALAQDIPSGIDAVPIHTPSMSMGFYRASWLRSESVRDQLRSIESFAVDPENVMLVKKRSEDLLFKFGGGRVGLLVQSREELGRRDVYGTGQLRLVEYYKHIDLYKHKANHNEYVSLSL
jgi:hypothetical protein